MKTETSLQRPSLLLLAFLSAGTAGAQLAPIGLSDVRASFFDNQELTSYTASTGDHFGNAVAAGDFNGDGAEDLAVAMPDANDVGGECIDCGLVIVRWGAPRTGVANGPATTVVHQGLAGSPDPPAAHERFGTALAAGDFNGDNYDDLAVGIPGDLSNQPGAVQIYYGWSTGLQLETSEYFTEADAGGGDAVCGGARFGDQLAVGNFDDDLYDDLVIGAPGGCTIQDDNVVRGGSVYVGHGQEWGVVPWFGYRITQDEVEMQDVVENGDQFGKALAAGRFDGDLYDDLAIGVPGENDYGLIQTLFGSQFGLLFATNIVWLPGALGEDPEPGDRLGRSLAAGDFDGDGFVDLAVGNPQEDLCDANERPDVGRVSIAYGAAAGFDLGRTKRIDPVVNCTDGDPASLFGWALAAGDFDGDGRDDLAVGQPNSDIGGGEAGRVRILMGESGSGFGGRARWLGPGTAAIPPGPAAHQHFGGALAAGDFDGNGWSDLAIGVPFRDRGETSDVGGVTVLYGALFADGFGIGFTGAWSDVSPPELP